MAFLIGRVTYTRFKADGDLPGMFGPDHLAKLEDAMIGKQRIATADGSQFGWIVGDHILNTRFDLANNIVNDSLQFAIRIDEHKLPADLLRSYYLTELQSMTAQNPSGFASARQKREARQIAKDRIEQEAKDGRFLRRKMVPIMWDGTTNDLLVGTTSASVIDRVVSLFDTTFARRLVCQIAGVAAEECGGATAVEQAAPSFSEDVAWTSALDDRDWLGNEFILWLWHVTENVSDTIKLDDGSEVALMLARSLTLECPRGQYGKESFTSDGPAKLPEALRALQVGRLPRKAGLTLVRHDQPYHFAVQAETLAVSSAKLPAPEAEDARAKLEERVSQIRHLVETMDLLYARFISERLSPAWMTTTEAMRSWLRSKAA